VDFDFVRYLNDFRYRHWAIDNSGTTASKIFAIQFVLGLVDNKTIYRVNKTTKRLRRQWIARLKDLVGRELWMPMKYTGGKWLSPYHPDFCFKKFSSAFRRCLFCRPAYVHFCSIDGRQVKIKPCWRLHICPFCWANLTAVQYIYLKQALATLRKADSKPYVLVSRVLRQFIPAPGFDGVYGATPQQLDAYATKLRGVIRKHKSRYAKLMAGKKFKKATAGAVWRLVVIPQTDGWLVEARQVFICRPNAKLPVIKCRPASVMYMESVKLNGPPEVVQEAVFHAFGEFCRYPRELLTGYSELTAAYLRAAHNVRLISGSGILRKTSRPLIHHMRKQREYAKARRAAKKAAARDSAAAAPAE